MCVFLSGAKPHGTSEAEIMLAGRPTVFQPSFRKTPRTRRLDPGYTETAEIFVMRIKAKHFFTLSLRGLSKGSVYRSIDCKTVIKLKIRPEHGPKKTKKIC